MFVCGGGWLFVGVSLYREVVVYVGPRRCMCVCACCTSADIETLYTCAQSSRVRSSLSRHRPQCSSYTLPSSARCSTT